MDKKHWQATAFLSTEDRPSTAVRRHLQHRRTRGKSLLARMLDAVLLLVVVFAAVWLFLLSKGIHVRHALLLAVIAALFVAVLYRMYSVWALQRFLPREIERLSRELLRRRMPFLEQSVMQSLCQMTAGIRDPIVLRSAETVGADALLPYLRDASEMKLVFCAPAGFTETAQKLAVSRQIPAKLIGAEPLLDAAMQIEELRPSVQDVYRQIEIEEEERKQRRRQARAFPIGGSGRRYLIAAGVLLLFSFRTGYALYYRMLASLCIGMAMLRGLLSRGVHTESVPRHIIS